MKKIRNSISRHALLRSLVILSLFGMPGIVQFDKTGVSHQFGLFNLQSLSRILLYLIIGIVVTLFTVGIEKLRFSKKYFAHILTPLSYYGIAILISLPVLSGVDSVLSVYFFFEWIIFFVLIYLYAKERCEISLELMIQDIVLLIWLKVISLLIIILFYPSLGIFIDNLHGYMRIGGYFVGPNVLGCLVAMLASYYFFYYEGPNHKKYGFFIIAVLLLFATSSRGALFSFIVAFSLSLIWSKKGWNHLILFYFGSFVTSFLITNLGYIMRGMGFSNILSLSERVPLWGKYFLEIGKSPIVGFGFISGVKKLGIIIPKIHWVAPHAHNDLVQAIMSGGIIMAILTFGIYYSLYKNCFSPLLTGRKQVLMKNWFIQLFGYGMLTPIISWKLFAISGIFWMLYITLKSELNHADPIRP